MSGLSAALSIPPVSIVPAAGDQLTPFRGGYLQRTRLGSHVVCEDRRLIFEEAPEAYKDIRAVITDLEQAWLVRVIARLRPLLSYKTRAS